jgi:hypothetical protein
MVLSWANRDKAEGQDSAAQLRYLLEAKSFEDVRKLRDKVRQIYISIVWV